MSWNGANFTGDDPPVLFHPVFELEDPGAALGRVERLLLPGETVLDRLADLERHETGHVVAVDVVLGAEATADCPPDVADLIHRQVEDGGQHPQVEVEILADRVDGQAVGFRLCMRPRPEAPSGRVRSWSWYTCPRR